MNKFVEFVFVWISVTTCSVFGLAALSVILFLLVQFCERAPMWASLTAGLLLVTGFISWLKVYDERPKRYSRVL